MIIDATNLILGRIGTFAAKSALLGKSVEIVNCEKAVITGSKSNVLAKYTQRLARGRPNKGPVLFRRPDMFVRRAIRGMLPYKQEKGRSAFERIRCHIGVPESFHGKQMETLQNAHINKIPLLKYMTVSELCGELGRWQK